MIVEHVPEIMSHLPEMYASLGDVASLQESGRMQIYRHQNLAGTLGKSNEKLVALRIRLFID